MNMLSKGLACLMGLLFTSSLFAQQEVEIAPAKPGTQYGAPISMGDAIAIASLESKLSADTVYNGKVEGKVVEVCKKKGCFMKLERAAGDPIMVKFKDYAFFMPQDIVGKTVVIDGEAKVRETSVERLKHFAEDAGKSKEEIAAINDPKKDIELVANGVVVVK
ncbi:DUF4920 domain-containing protein [Olivibacter sitiensis]|uniref:DUF4920 domain-containing protein n=1 Tax=Olivibacter sitiensis TaxID=376470 RepID=UPI001FE2313F|nr:DUF4920 domain-containing protein [Olivibacter sitiensis]